MNMPSFVDGLGRRVPVDGPDGEGLEGLRLSPEMTDRPQIEAALLERAASLSLFDNPAFPPFRRVERLPGVSGGLVVVSVAAPGMRLSEVLRQAERRVVDPDPAAIWSIVREAVSATASLHRHGADASHGALGPERIVVRPDGSTAIVEYVLASALEQLQLSRSQLWNVFQVAAPTTAGTPRLDQQADVLQLGMIALALLLGRMLRRDEFPGRPADLLIEAATRGTLGHRPGLSRTLRWWAARALQLDPRCAFRTAVEAEEGLAAALGAEDAPAPSTSAVLQYVARSSGEVVLVQPVAVMPPRPPAADSGSLPLVRGYGAQVLVPPKPWSPLGRAARLITIVIGLVVLWGATYLGARTFLGLPTLPARTGTLSVESRPEGLPLLVDGVPRGRTPVTLELRAGSHTLALQTARGTTLLPVTVAPGVRKVERVDVRAGLRVRR